MSKSTQPTAGQLSLPYKEITETASRQTIRENSVAGRSTHYVDFKKLQIREGFNVRKVYTEIKEFAEFIELNGLPDPLVVDMTRDGKIAYIEQGHRRYQALMLLNEKTPLKKLSLPGINNGKIECFVNNASVDELTRVLRQYSSNKSVNYTPMELAELCSRLKTNFGLTNKQIGEKLGMSRQSVDNHIILAAQPEEVKEAVKKKETTATTVVANVRTMEKANKLNEKNEEDSHKTSSKPLVGQQHVLDEDRKQQREEKAAGKETDLPKFDESREEIKLCQNLVKNLDKIGSIVSKIENKQTKDDIERLLHFSQKDLALLRDWVHKNKKENKKAI